MNVVDIFIFRVALYGDEINNRHEQWQNSEVFQNTVLGSEPSETRNVRTVREQRKCRSRVMETNNLVKFM